MFGKIALVNREFIYVDGSMVPYADATIDVSSVAAKYGANVFEGQCADNGDGEQSFVFRLHEHLVRAQRSVRMMQIDGDPVQSRAAGLSAHHDC
jgi:branched-chain amino acid aminotransferase